MVRMRSRFVCCFPAEWRGSHSVWFCEMWCVRVSASCALISVCVHSGVQHCVFLVRVQRIDGYFVSNLGFCSWLVFAISFCVSFYSIVNLVCWRCFIYFMNVCMCVWWIIIIKKMLCVHIAYEQCRCVLSACLKVTHTHTQWCRHYAF